VQAVQAKQAANYFRQRFKIDLGHLMTVNLNTFRIERLKAKPAPQQSVLIVPEKKSRFKPVEEKQKDMPFTMVLR